MFNSNVLSYYRSLNNNGFESLQNNNNCVSCSSLYFPQHIPKPQMIHMCIMLEPPPRVAPHMPFAFFYAPNTHICMDILSIDLVHQPPLPSPHNPTSKHCLLNFMYLLQQSILKHLYHSQTREIMLP